ncbi:MAG: T9SS type A sorting domain-containing protein [Ignavibacteriae bacterium]|nr:T9SS type A sorting domain-containing protein [Ignavibacteriota bacterium]
MRRLLFVFVITLIIKFYSFTQPVVFPLNNGDYWEYNFIKATIIGDTVLGDGFSYFIQEQSEGVYRYYAYLRQAGDSVFLDKKLWYDFSRSPGDTIATYRFSHEGLTRIILVEAGIDTFFTFHSLRYWRFAIDLEGDRFYQTVVDSVGIIKYVYPNPNVTPIELKGALVNGKLFGEVTGVDEISETHPTFMILQHNYPNPFNPSTVIQYQLSTGSFVTLKIYNSFGQEVATLLNEQKPAGEYSVPFNAENLPSGVYVYRLNAVGNNQTYTQSRKMIYLK